MVLSINFPWPAVRDKYTASETRSKIPATDSERPKIRITNIDRSMQMSFWAPIDKDYQSPVAYWCAQHSNSSNLWEKSGSGVISKGPFQKRVSGMCVFSSCGSFCMSWVRFNPWAPWKMKNFSTHQIKISLPVAATFKRNILFLSVLLWWKGPKFQFWSTINVFFALLLFKINFLHCSEDLLPFNVTLLSLNFVACKTFNCPSVAGVGDAKIIHSSLKLFKRS